MTTERRTGANTRLAKKPNFQKRQMINKKIKIIHRKKILL